MKPNNFARMGIICTQKTHLHCSALTKSPAGRDTIHFMEKRTPALNYVIRQDTASTLSSAWTLFFLSKKGGGLCVHPRSGEAGANRFAGSRHSTKSKRSGRHHPSAKRSSEEADICFAEKAVQSGVPAKGWCHLRSST
jgi:hypothetical protein